MSNEDYIPEEGYDIARDMGKIPPTKDRKMQQQCQEVINLRNQRSVNQHLIL